MHAEIIAVGSELTTGAKLDTNSQWLSLELSAVGIPVHYHTTVADDLEANISVLRIAIDRSDLVIISGGLGPTLDDLTRDALAGVLGVPLVLHEPSLEIIRGMFTRRNRVMPERNVVQAMFPEGSVPIPNPRGTAPGVSVEVPRPGRSPCRIAALPGVPSEMKHMFRESVLPQWAGAATGRVIRHARVNCFGLGESACEELLGDLTARGRDPEVGITVHEATITLRIVAEGETIAACQEKISTARQAVYERIGEYVFGEEDEELQHTVLRMLAERQQTLSVAESATGGVLAQWLSGVTEFGGQFLGGVMAPTDSSKIALLGVDPVMITSVGAVSADVAGAMAEGCRERFHADFALAVTDSSANQDTESNANAPLAWIALSDGKNVTVRELNLAGDPAIARSRTAKAALNLLRLKLK